MCWSSSIPIGERITTEQFVSGGVLGDAELRRPAILPHRGCSPADGFLRALR